MKEPQGRGSEADVEKPKDEDIDMLPATRSARTYLRQNGRSCLLEPIDEGLAKDFGVRRPSPPSICLPFVVIYAKPR